MHEHVRAIDARASAQSALLERGAFVTAIANGVWGKDVHEFDMLIEDILQRTSLDDVDAVAAPIADPSHVKVAPGPGDFDPSKWQRLGDDDDDQPNG